MSPAGNFVEVFLAKEGHDAPVGINYLELPVNQFCSVSFRHHVWGAKPSAERNFGSVVNSRARSFRRIQEWRSRNEGLPCARCSRLRSLPLLPFRRASSPDLYNGLGSVAPVWPRLIPRPGDDVISRTSTGSSSLTKKSSQIRLTVVAEPVQKKPTEFFAQLSNPVHDVLAVSDERHEAFVKIVLLKVKNTIPEAS